MKHALMVFAMSAAILAGCQKPENGTNNNQPEVKPPTEKPGDVTTGDDYSGWNTTGKFIPVDEDATLNPNFFLLDWDKTEILELNEEDMTVTLSFIGPVPSMYKGALTIIEPDGTMPFLCYVEEAKMGGTNVTLKFREAELSELFFNQSFAITTDAANCFFKDCQIFAKEGFYSADGIATKAGSNLNFENSKFVNVTDKFSYTDMLVPGLNYKHSTSMSLIPSVYCQFDKPITDGVSSLIKADLVVLSAVLEGELEFSEDVSLGASFNTGDLFSGNTKPWTVFTKWIGVPVHGITIPVMINLEHCVKVGAKISGSINGYRNVTTNKYTATVGAEYRNGKLNPIKDFRHSKSTESYPSFTGEVSAEAKFTYAPLLTIAPIGVVGITVEVDPYVTFGITAKYVEDKISGSFDVYSGADLALSVVRRTSIFSPSYMVMGNLPSIEIVKQTKLYSYPNTIEPKNEKDVKNLKMGYNDKKKIRHKASAMNYTREDNGGKVPADKSLVKVEVVSNMPSGTEGTTTREDGLVVHDIVYYEADENGEINHEYRVPGPLGYDYTFETSVLGGDGEPVETYTIKPTNKFKGFVAEYKPVDPSSTGSVRLIVDEYGRKVYEQGTIVRHMYMEGYHYIGTFNVNSYNEELLEDYDVDLSEIGSGIMRLTADVKYMVGLFVDQDVIGKVDYYRWDQMENGNYHGYQHQETVIDTMRCVHCTGPGVTEEITQTDITYWYNVPVMVATGELAGDEFGLFYMKLSSLEVFGEDDKSPDIPADDRPGHGDDPGTGSGSGDDDENDSEYYVRVDHELENWEGKYLIVFDEEGNESFLPGNLSNIYDSYNGQGTHAKDGHILVTAANENSYFTISRLPDGKYTIYSSKDFYLGCKDRESAAFDRWADEPIPHTISYDTANHCILIQGYYDHTLCYDEKWHQFIYATWTDYSSGMYRPIQLYKLNK